MSNSEHQGPAWLREFATTLSVHSQFVFHGNIRDQFVTGDGSQLAPLRAMVWEVLQAQGFSALITYDLVDGLGAHPVHGPAAVLAKQTAGEMDSGIGRHPELRELRREIETVVNAPHQRAGLLFDHASRVADGQNDLGREERDFFLACAKLSGSAVRHGSPGSPIPFNPLIWLVDSVRDLPAWLSSNNAHVRCIPIPLPDLAVRVAAARILTAPMLPDDARTDQEAARGAQQVIERFALEAHGMSLDGMSGVTQLARQTKIDFEELPQAVATYRLGVVENPWREGLLRLRIKECQSDLGKRVKGQPQAVARSLDTLKRAVMGMSGSHTGNPTSRPRGVLFFAGPTGVGKTELAKAMAQLVYGDEGALLRFDMSEFAEAHTADRLIGAPPGYVGYDAGGQLTNAVRSQPFRVILFDEIDKAHPLVLDKFLQILEDGRLTDGHGETTYFSESILIFTSNLGVQETDPRTGETKNLIEPGTPYQEVEKAVHTAIGHHFKTKLKRPELLNRIGDNIIVFDFIGSQAAEAIFVAQMENVATLIEREHDLSIEVPSHLVEKLRQKCTRDTTFGGRGIGNQLEAYFVNPLARTLFDNDFAPGSALVVVSLNDRDFPASIEVANRE